MKNPTAVAALRQDAPARADWYTLIVVLIYEFACGVDIAQVSLLVKPIEATYRINDTAFAALAVGSLAFGRVPLYYLGGVLADTYRRRTLMLISGSLWTVAAFSVLFAAHAWQFGAARFLGGVALSLGGPSIFHIILDSFSRDRRTFAVSLFGAGVALGTGLGLALCGGNLRLAEGMGRVVLPYAGEVQPWQLCFVFVGALGIVAVALLLTIREPTRLETLVAAQERNVFQSLRIFAGYMRQHGLFWAVFISANFAIDGLTQGLTTWQPTLANRVFGISLPAAAAALGTLTAATSIAGRLLGGSTGQWLVNRGRAALLPQMFVYTCIPIGLLFIAFPLVTSFPLSLFLIGAATVLIGMTVMLYSNAIQDIVPNEVRGQIIGISSFFSPIATIVGTVGIAYVSDRYFGGGTGLRASFSVVGGGAGLVAALAFGLCVRQYRATRREVLLETQPAAEPDQAGQAEWEADCGDGSCAVPPIA
ncbi:MAG: MFS transporter [Candidatus Eremiobacteraeota bacterium]|nr:MFS transporter [Candidatus Eremiobacteraeota bacterium]